MEKSGMNREGQAWHMSPELRPSKIYYFVIIESRRIWTSSSGGPIEHAAIITENGETRLGNFIEWPEAPLETISKWTRVL